MAPSTNAPLPLCGLYKTTKPLPSHEPRVGENALVYFHNHSDSGLPQIILPDHNIHNRWHFHGPGIEFRSLSWASSLVSVPPEGFYVLRSELTFDGGSWPKSALVQLGYTNTADPILFIATQRSRLNENDLFFEERGIKIPFERMVILDPLVVHVQPDDGSSGHAPNVTH